MLCSLLVDAVDRVLSSEGRGSDESFDCFLELRPVLFKKSASKKPVVSFLEARRIVNIAKALGRMFLLTSPVWRFSFYDAGLHGRFTLAEDPETCRWLYLPTMEIIALLASGIRTVNRPDFTFVAEKPYMSARLAGTWSLQLCFFFSLSSTRLCASTPSFECMTARFVRFLSLRSLRP